MGATKSDSTVVTINQTGVRTPIGEKHEQNAEDHSVRDRHSMKPTRAGILGMRNLVLVIQLRAACKGWNFALRRGP